jgi:hypothetical protein
MDMLNTLSKEVQELSAGYDTDSGFAWINFKHDDEHYEFNCCLKSRKDGKGFMKEVSRNDTGSYDGMCLGSNRKAIGDFEFEDLEALMLTTLRKVGVRITR